MILLLFAGIVLCVLLWKFAIYALPALAGLQTGQLAYSHGAGTIGAMVCGGMTAMVCLGAMQVSFSRCRSPIVRNLLALIFVLPAVIVSYNLAWDITAIDEMLPIWRLGLSALTACIAGTISYGKLARYTDR